MKQDRYSDFVEHIRYGRGPRRTGLDPQSGQPGVFLHWHQTRIGNTAIEADLTRQTPSTVPVTHYFDLKRCCRHCRRPFIFFAEEQRYWYEELRLPLEADAVRCQPCRKDVREWLSLRREYDRLAAGYRTDEETLEMVRCALILIDAGVLPVEVSSKLKGLLRKLPESPRRDACLEALQ